MIVGRRFAVCVGVALMSAGALPSVQARRGWDEDTHGRNAVPDYARVFQRDRVNRLDIAVAPADWQLLVADMTDMAGPFGRDRSRSSGGFARIEPPPEAMAACAGKAEGDGCTFGTPPAMGRCVQVPQAALACFPMPTFAGPGAQGADDVEFLPRTPLYVPATIMFDGTEFRRVGIRLKGNSSLVNAWGAGNEKLPFRLNFDELEDRFPEIRDQTFFGFPNLNLTNNAMDASFLRAKVVGDLLRDSGVPSSRTAFVRVYLDRGAGAAYLGLYTLVEVPDSPMLITQFGSDEGNLYKPRGAGGRWLRFDRDSFPKKTNAEQEDWTDIEDAIAALNAPRADAAGWRARLEARFDVDGFLRWLAFNTIIGNFDAYGGLSPHNYWVYGSPRDRDRLHWIPWDHDLALEGFGMGGPRPDGPAPGAGPGPLPPDGPPGVVIIGPGNRGPREAGVDLFHDEIDGSWPLIRWLLDDAVYRATYRRHLEDILATTFQPSRVMAQLRSEHALIARDVIGPEGEQPGRTFLDSAQRFDDALHGPEGLLAYVQARYALLRDALAGAR